MNKPSKSSFAIYQKNKIFDEIPTHTEMVEMQDSEELRKLFDDSKQSLPAHLQQTMDELSDAVIQPTKYTREWLEESTREMMVISNSHLIYKFEQWKVLFYWYQKLALDIYPYNTSHL